jgi:hypothetical protein
MSRNVKWRVEGFYLEIEIEITLLCIVCEFESAGITFGNDVRGKGRRTE